MIAARRTAHPAGGLPVAGHLGAVSLPDRALLILIWPDGFDYTAAAAIAETLLAASLLLLSLINVSQTWLRARLRTEG